MTAPHTSEAPLNDLKLMVQSLEYPHTATSVPTSKKLGLHLWYLSEELVGLALFNSRIAPESKKLMLSAMEQAAPEHLPKRPRVRSDTFCGSRGLEQFCATNSKETTPSAGDSRNTTLARACPVGRRCIFQTSHRHSQGVGSHQ